MRVKLDENIAQSAVDRLTALGHDVHTAWERCFVVATLNKVRVRRPPEP